VSRVGHVSVSPARHPHLWLHLIMSIFQIIIGVDVSVSGVRVCLCFIV
jgi:hypothetical protein